MKDKNEEYNKSRREFNKTLATALMGLPFLGRAMGNGISIITQDEVEARLGKTLSPDFIPDRTIVFIKQNGGNDGLRTIYYNPNFQNLKTVQSPDLVPEFNELLPLNGVDYSVAPFASGLQTLFNAGNAAIFNAAGMLVQNGSHFFSRDLKERGKVNQNDADSSTGYLGRRLEVDYPNYPVGYSGEFPPAITFGSNEPMKTCDGYGKNYSTVVNDFTQVSNFSGVIPYDGDYNSDKLAHIKQIGDLTNQFSVAISLAYASGFSASNSYGSDSLAQKLQEVLLALAGGLKVFAISIDHNGYDTHSGQVDVGSPNTGRHPKLTKQLYDGVLAFQTDLEANGLDNRVITFISGEFDRRVAQNGSYGTDHGRGGNIIIVGTCVTGGIYGTPFLVPDTPYNGSVPITLDYLDVVASMLHKFLGDPLPRVMATFADTPINIFNFFECSDVGILEESLDEELNLEIFPNPASSYINLQADTSQGIAQLDVYDMSGALIVNHEKIIHEDGVSDMNIGIQSLASGSYLLVVTDEKGKQQEGRFIKH